MNKFLTLLLLCIQLSALDVLTEGKVGYFIPTDAQFRSTYGEDSVVGAVEVSVLAGSNFYPWVGATLYDTVAHSGGVRRHMYFIPIGAGLKYIYPFRYLSIYGGLGALPTYLHISKERESKWGCGGVAKFGFISNRIWNLFVDLFAEYSYIPISSPAPNPSNLNNFTIGGGVGYRFGPTQCVDEEDE